MIIDQLPEISSVQATDELPIERGTTTYKTPLSKLSDNSPTSESEKPVKSGGVYTALRGKAATDLGITGASVGDIVRIKSVSSGKPTAFERISNPNKNVAVVQDGNTATQNISAGQYVIWKGSLYTASSAITSGTTLSASNLTSVSGGGLNALNSLIAASVPSKSVTMPSAAASFTLNIPNNARFIMCASDSSLNRCALFHVISFASGSVFAKEIGTSNFTFDTSTTNRLKVTMSSSGQVALSVWAISGSKASLNSVYFVT